MKHIDRDYIKEAQEANWLDAGALKRIAEAIGALNAGEAINDCKMGDLRHVVEFLARIILLEQVAPGFTASMIDTFLPHFIRNENRAIVAAEAQRRADADGFGDAWSRVVEAGLSKGQRGFKAALTDLVMAADGVDIEDAINRVADHYEVDPESVKRSIRRARRKP